MRVVRTSLVLLLALSLAGAMPFALAAPGKGRGGDRDGATLSSTSVSALDEGDATLVVVANAEGAEGTFAFETTGGEGLPERFTLSTAEGAARITFAGLRANHTYSLQEDVPAGWNLSAAACDAGTPERVVIPANATVTCTFDNLRLGDLLVVLDATGADLTLPFLANATNATGLPEAFNVTTVNGTASRLFHVTPNVTLSLAPQVPGGWNLTGAACDQGAPDNLTLASNATTTCRFDLARLNTLIVRVNAFGGEGTLAFNATGGGGLPASFALTTVEGVATLAFADLETDRTYALAPLVPEGWSLAAATCSEGAPGNLTLGAGRDVTCTFNLTREGAVTLVVLSRGGDGLFPFAASGPSLPAAFNVATVNGTGVQVFHDITPDERLGLALTTPPGWRLLASACSAGTPDNFSLPAGGSVTCTFELTRLAEVRGLVYHDLNRNATPDANEAGLAGWRVWLDLDNDATLDADESAASTDAGGRYALVDLPHGGYALRLELPGGWALIHPAASHVVTLGEGTSLDHKDFAVATATPPPQDDDKRDEDKREGRGERDRDGAARGPGFWKNWDKHDTYAESELDAWMRDIDASSAWLMPAGYAATADGLASLLKDGGKSCNRSFGHHGCAEKQLETRLLVLRLNLAAGLLAETDTVDLHRDAAAYLGFGQTATVRQVLDAIEAKADASPTRDQLHLMRHAVQRAMHGDD